MLKILFRVPMIGLVLIPAIFCQPASFDIATYVAPVGWKRTDSPGLRMYEDRQSRSGRTEFCQIYLFASKPGNGTPSENFEVEWNEKIVRPLGIAERPRPQTEKTPEGWTALTAAADVVRQGVPMRNMLLVASGLGRVFTVVVNISGDTHVPAVTKFFNDLELRGDSKTTGQEPGPGPGPGATGPTPQTSVQPGPAAEGTLSDYIYAIPDKWSQQQAQGAIMLASQTFPNGERCQIIMWPMRPAGRNLAEDTISLFREWFKTDPLTFSPYPWPKLARGVSPQGWEYFVIRKSVGGYAGDGRLVGVVFLTAKLGDRIAPVVATSKDPLVSNCLGELVGDAWPRFFASLQFRSMKPSPQVETAIKQRLQGTWITATGSVGSRYVFLANGRYQGAAGSQTRQRVSPGEILQTTTAYFGDGKYSFDGNTITLTGDDKRTSRLFFRLGQESKDGGKSWTDSLCLADPVTKGEVCYVKE